MDTNEMMAPAPKHDPNAAWYIQVINAVSDVVLRILSLKGGMATLIIVWVLTLISWATFQFGRPITDAIVSKLSAESAAATAVSGAVTRLTSVSENQQDRLDNIEKCVTDGEEFEQRTDKFHGEQAIIMQDIAAAMKELLGWLRKNEQAPPTPNDGGA